MLIFWNKGIYLLSHGEGELHMNRYEETYRNHAVHNTLNTLMTLFENIDLADFTDEESIYELKRLGKILEITKGVLDNVAPEIVYLGNLNTLNSYLNSSYSSLSSFITNKSLSYLRAANDHLNNGIPIVQQLESFKSTMSLRSFGQTASKLSKQNNEIIKMYSNSVKKMDLEYKEIENKVIELKKKIDDQIIRTETTINGYNESFQKAQEKRNDTFYSKIDEFNDKEKKLFSGIEDRHNFIIEEKRKFYVLNEENFNETGKKILDALEDNKQKAENYLKIITNIGTSGQFSKYAQKEGKFSIGYNILGVLGMIVSSYLAYELLIKSIGETTLFFSISKIFTVSLLFIPSTYCVKEGSKHKRRETYYRKMELELATIDTFIENLEPKNREAIKIELTKKLFGSNDIEFDLEEMKKKKKSGDLSISDAMELLKKLGIKKESVVELIKIIREAN